MFKSDITAFVNRARQEYSDAYESMNWLTPETAAAASGRRENVLRELFEAHLSGPGWQFSGTKLFTHALSPGCTLCGQGDWSCLFINGVCNAKCFYCPSDQKIKGQPVTSTLEFSNPNDYADYIKAFNIKGVSFSGGEPFMTFDRVLLFLKTLRAKVSHPLYIWMYTNGLLVTEDNLKALKDNGLDEIRFDISANSYRLEAMEKAVGIIPCVTVEIPAIPEHVKETKKVISALHDAGVNYLNLHQIRCTQFNKNNLIQRGYTFINGPGIATLETEMAALELIRYSLDEKIALPINYCSFTYRHQFQRAGAQRRNALKIKADHEDITVIGRVRTMSVCGPEKEIRDIDQHLLSKTIDPSSWRLSKACDQLFFNADLWPLIDFSNVRLKVSYSGTALKSAVSFRHVFKEVALNRKKKVVIERHVQHSGVFFEGAQITQFFDSFVSPDILLSEKITRDSNRDFFDEVRGFESFSSGLAEYC